MNIVEKVAARIPESDPLRAVLGQQSRAYGNVAAKLETLAGFVMRGQESEPSGRQAFAELVDAIHAPREEAQRHAVRLHELIRDVTPWEHP